VVATACPSDDVLGAFAQHALGPAEVDTVSAHLDDCDGCRSAMLAVARSVTPQTVSERAGRHSALRLRGPVSLGTRVGRYQLRSLLGAGGMGHVYEAYDADLDRAIALKVLRPELAGSAMLLAERLRRESRLTAKVVHPAVMTIHDVGADGDAVFIAMEPVRGKTLGAYVTRPRPPWRTVISLYERAAEGLAAAHAAGVVHRDFKPDNVLVELDGDVVKRVVVSDFGIARAADIVEVTSPAREGGDIRLTQTGAALGTPAYMAPEQLGGASVDRRADVFAFCVSLWEAVMGARPFSGSTPDAIRRAMLDRPRPTRRVPRRLVRALEKGLAYEPAERWSSMSDLARELRSLGGRRRRHRIAIGAAALIGVGIAGALLATRAEHVDPCALPPLAYDRAALSRALSGTPAHDRALYVLDGIASAWRGTFVATCVGGRTPALLPPVAACLDARRIELEGVASDLIAHGADQATSFVQLVGNPASCANPSAASSFTRVPDDPALRGKVYSLRKRAFAAEAARNRAEIPQALAAAQQLVAEAHDVWPPVEAEVLYLLGNTQSIGGSAKEGAVTLRKAAAVAQAAHHDYIAATIWIQLIQTRAFDDGDPEGALEYVSYAEAAISRLGSAPLVAAELEYARGVTLVQLSRMDEAEVALQKAVAIASHGAPTELVTAISGLGYLYQEQGRYAEAVDAYRKALGALAPADPVFPSGQVTFRSQLAQNLTLLGKHDEAVAVAREAVAIAERTLAADSVDRALARGQLAEVLQGAGKLVEALAESTACLDEVARLTGTKSERYAELLLARASIETDMGQFAAAHEDAVRGGQVIGFTTGEDSADQATAWFYDALALSGLGRNREALALVDKVIPQYERLLGDLHPQLANALYTRAGLRSRLGDHAGAIVDLERSLEQFDELSLDRGFFAAAQVSLAAELWRSDPARAHALVNDAPPVPDAGGDRFADERALAHRLAR